MGGLLISLNSIMRRSEGKFCGNKGDCNAARIVCILLMVCVLTASLSSCIAYRALRLPQLREFERKVHSKYPLASVSCKYAYGADVSINVSRVSVDEESAYTILGYLQPIVCSEDFLNDFLEFFEEEKQKHPKWQMERPPDIYLDLDGGTICHYQFTTRAYTQNYDDVQGTYIYTWDGYATWYGGRTLFHESGYEDDEHQEIHADEIEEALKKYSQDRD